MPRTIHPLQLFVLAVFALLAGCAAGPGPVQQFEPPVFPPPPEPARFHYERTILSSADVLEEAKDAGLRRMLTGERRSGIGMGKPYGVAVHKGRVFVSDTERRSVMVFDTLEHKFFEIGIKRPGVLAKPLGVDVDSAGNVYVCDSSAKLIQVYSRDGEHLRTIGKRDDFDRPSGITVDPAGSRVYVTDTGGVDSTRHQVVVFDAASGEHLYNFSKRGAADGELNLPREATLGADGLVYVVDGGNFRVQAFKPDGSYVKTVGGIGRRGGQFSRPKGVAVDAQGQIYVSDAAFGNFQIFDPQGQLLLDVGRRGSSGEPATFMLPAGITVGEDGRVYLVDQFFKKVDVFRPDGLELGAAQSP